MAGIGASAAGWSRKSMETQGARMGHSAAYAHVCVLMTCAGRKKKGFCAPIVSCRPRPAPLPLVCLHLGLCRLLLLSLFLHRVYRYCTRPGSTLTTFPALVCHVTVWPQDPCYVMESHTNDTHPRTHLACCQRHCSIWSSAVPWCAPGVLIHVVVQPISHTYIYTSQ
eukprot:scaffold327539_cov52-Tisochrysis_lutea.AAC.1